jgi:DNA (cytosine-5)-methyltransferase 1
MWNAREHADLVGPTRHRLIATGLPYVIENVPGAPLLDPISVCGTSLGLGTATHEIRRHRLFETNFPVMAPPCAHTGKPTLGIYGDHARDCRRGTSVEKGGQFRAADGLAMAQEAFEMPWGNWRELSQAIPPAYTELIGAQLLDHLRARAAA